MDEPLSKVLTAALAAALIAGLAACGAPAEVTAEGSSGGEMTVAENTNAPPDEAPPESETPPAGEGTWDRRSGSGRSAEDPVGTCGPGDSYAFVAREFRCPEGDNPLRGNPAAGANARVGNVGANATGHIIDLYRVPCASGPVDVFVDMYDCPEMQEMFGE